MTATDRTGGHRRFATSRQVGGRFLRQVGGILAVSVLCLSAPAADIEDGEWLFRTGQYDECSKLADAELERSRWGDAWSILKVRSELARGRYEAAAEAVEAGIERSPTSIPLRLLSRDAYRFAGREDEADGVLDEIERVILTAPTRYGTAEGRVALGRFFLLRGADARKVLDQFFDVARKARPDFAEAWLATAELALEKQDDALAADSLRDVPEEAKADPRYHHLLARAFSNSDRARSAEELKAALEVNPYHVDSLLLQADQLIDAERYDEAKAVLEEVFEVNPHEPRGRAFEAVIAHLRNESEGEAAARKAALATWPKNPEVDHLIGRELSQKYRFAEGAAAQRRALVFDPLYRSAKVQLCQDLLRLGEEEEGWKLADEVFAEDGYDVVGFNLVTLRDEISGYTVLRDDGFIVKMEAKEAALYGDRVLALLREARDALCPKYGAAIDGEVTIEIFPHQKDFAVRTFGLPGADGFLGVCFGKVITINSPASQGASPSNWESVLWHEYCHAVTLTKTKNKMPRWLSEGISVYEEGQRDPACATPLSPAFRKMLLGEDFTPLSKLSSAFMAPKSAMHLQFAYFESSLAVEFLIERFGLPTLKDLLADLGKGTAVNEALIARTETPLDRLDAEFERFAKSKAEAVAPGLTWEQPELPPNADSDAVAEWLESHPDSFFGLQRLGTALVAEEKWEEAREVLEKLKRLYPDYVGAENAYVLLAAASRKLGRVEEERAVLEELARRDADATEAFARLAELAEAEGNWQAAAENAERMLAVNPLVPAPHRRLAVASEALGDSGRAVSSYRALSLLDDTDPAGIHFRLAKLLRASGKQDEALRETLKSLEEAPRFTEAHRLLLELVDARPVPDKVPPKPVEAPRP